MFEIFKTNIQNFNQADKVAEILKSFFPEAKINFDLDDCDRILRIKGKNFSPSDVIQIVRNEGFDCDIMP